MHIILGNVEVKWPVAVMTSLEMRARNLKDLGIRGSGSSWYKTNHPDELLWWPFLTQKNTWLFGRYPYFSSFLSGGPSKKIRHLTGGVHPTSMNFPIIATEKASRPRSFPMLVSLVFHHQSMWFSSHILLVLDDF